MPYTDSTEIYKAFGQQHVEKWADVDNDQNATTIANHITWAITYADELIDSLLRSTHWKLSLVTAAGATPTLIKYIATEIAGDIIRGNKGEYMPADQDPYVQRRNRAMQLLEDIYSGKRKLDALEAAD